MHTLTIDLFSITESQQSRILSILREEKEPLEFPQKAFNDLVQSVSQESVRFLRYLLTATRYETPNCWRIPVQGFLEAENLSLGEFGVKVRRGLTRSFRVKVSSTATLWGFTEDPPTIMISHNNLRQFGVALEYLPPD